MADLISTAGGSRAPRGSGSLAGRFVVALVVAMLVGASARAVAADQQDLEAREAFAAGRYQQALDTYAKLFAKTLHPTYLRNVGRCHQMLGNADQAINSFNEYLRRAPNLSESQRAEVKGFIAEMEALKKQRASNAAAAEPPKSVDRPGPTPGQGGLRPGVDAAAADHLAPGSGPEATVEKARPSSGEAAEPSRPESLGHGGQFGLIVRGDTALLPARGIVIAPGLSYGLGDHFEIAAGGLLGGQYKGGWIEARALFASGALKALVSLGLPVFVINGDLPPGTQSGVQLGIQPGVGGQWDASRHFGLFAELTASIFPNAGAELRRFWLVPTLGVQGRL